MRSGNKMTSVAITRLIFLCAPKYIFHHSLQDQLSQPVRFVLHACNMKLLNSTEPAMMWKEHGGHSGLGTNTKVQKIFVFKEKKN